MRSKVKLVWERFSLLLKKLWQKRKSIIINWFISYISILLVPVLISVFVYMKSNEALGDEINRANDAMLKQVQLLIDNHIADLIRLNIEITWNPRIQGFLYGNAQTGPEIQYDILKITQDLKAYQSSYGFTSDFYLYCPGVDTALLPGTQRNGKLLYESIHISEKMTYDQWLAIMKRKDLKGLIPMPRRREMGQEQQSVAYVASLKPGASDQPVGTIVIMVDEAKLLEAIQSVQWFKGGGVFVVNRDNDILVSSIFDENIKDFHNNVFSETSGMFTDKLDNQDSLFFYIKSKYSDLTYISVIPKHTFMEKSENIRKLTWLAVMISILGGFILAGLFLKKNYNPINKLVQALTDKAGVGVKRDWNEYLFIQEAVYSSLDEKEKISERLKQQDKIIRSSFLTRLLKGRLDNKIPIADELSAFKMKFESDDFSVILLYIENFDNFLADDKSMDINEKYKLIQFIIANVVEEIACQKHRGFVCEVDNVIACLVNFNENDSVDKKNELHRIASEAQDFILRKFNIHLTISISGIHTGTREIAISYNEALEALEYKIVVGSAEIIHFEDIDHEHDVNIRCSYYYPLHLEQHLINCAKVGDFESARHSLLNIFDSNLKNSQVSAQIVKCLMFDMAGTMLKTLNEACDVPGSPFVEELNPVERLTSCKSIKEMKGEMTKILEQVCNYTRLRMKSNMSNQRESAVKGLNNDIIRYIEENYTDINLNISMIGERFKLTPTYLSKLFKDQSGESLLDYIGKVRVEKAKQLLSDNNYNILDVAEAVGFINSNAFIRAFKRYEGVTPGKYKISSK